METVDVLMKMPKIEGYEYTGEYREAVPGDCYYCNIDRVAKQTPIGSMFEKIILRKAEAWKPLTLEKAIEFVQNKKVVRLRRINCLCVAASLTDAISRVSVDSLSRYPSISTVGHGHLHIGGTDGNWEYLEQ